MEQQQGQGQDVDKESTDVNEAGDEAASKGGDDAVLRMIEDEDIPAEVLELVEAGKVDMSMPAGFMDELMGTELADHLASFHKMVPLRKAARSSGDNKRAEDLGKAINTARLAVALINHQYPGAKAKADEIARTRERQISGNRKRILDDNDGE